MSRLAQQPWNLVFLESSGVGEILANGEVHQGILLPPAKVHLSMAHPMTPFEPMIFVG